MVADISTHKCARRRMLHTIRHNRVLFYIPSSKKRPVFRPRIGPPGITLQGIKFLFGWGQQPFATNVRIIPVKANFLWNFRVLVIPGFRQYDYRCIPIPIQDNGNFGLACLICGNVPTNQIRTL